MRRFVVNAAPAIYTDILVGIFLVREKPFISSAYKK
jgi:hypothetical protein